jgi:hypothetical protein
MKLINGNFIVTSNYDWSPENLEYSWVDKVKGMLVTSLKNNQ